MDQTINKRADKQTPTFAEILYRRRKLFVITLLLSLLLTFSIAPSFAQSIDFDASVLITQVNTWIVIFLPILSIGMGISIAIALVEKVGNSILQAFRN
jgi:hypothetical protein